MLEFVACVLVRLLIASSVPCLLLVRPVRSDTQGRHNAQPAQLDIMIVVLDRLHVQLAPLLSAPTAKIVIVTLPVWFVRLDGLGLLVEAVQRVIQERLVTAARPGIIITLVFVVLAQ